MTKIIPAEISNSMHNINLSLFGQIDETQMDLSILNKDLDKFKIDLSVNYPEVKYLLKYKGVGCFPLSDLVALKGKAKQGKSFLITSLATALLKGEFMGFEAQDKTLSVLVVDTEQNPLNVALSVRKVHTLCDWPINSNNPRFNSYSLRECTHLERRKALENAILLHKPDVVFLDGGRDIILDFNSISESAEVIGFLMSLTKLHNVTLVCVLHENKADVNMRGHFGTELLNKCSEAYQVKKAGDIIQIDQTEARNKPIDNFSFRLDENGLPEAVEVPTRITSSDSKAFLLRNNIDALFSTKSSYKNMELVTAYIVLNPCSEATAQRHIANAVEKNFISKNNTGVYTLKTDELC